MFSQKNANAHSKRGNVSEEISKYSKRAETLKGSSQSVTLELCAYRADSCMEAKEKGMGRWQCFLIPA